MNETIASRIAPSIWASGPGALIRTLDGVVTYWSPEMEYRYGFAPQEAVGQVAHELLRTTSWQALSEIETILMNRNTWRGGLIHHRADGQPVVASNHWHLHYQPEGRTTLVTELHSDIVPGGTPAGNDLADILAALAHQLSEPLTAIGGYINAAQRDLQPAWPDKVRAGVAIDRAGGQLARAREALNRMRALGTRLRDRQQVAMHARLTGTMEQIERTMTGLHAAAMDAASARREGERTRQRLGQAEQPGERSLERTVAQQNIRLFQRLLQQHESSKLDARSRQMVTQLLIEEEAKLTAFDRQ